MKDYKKRMMLILIILVVAFMPILLVWAELFKPKENVKIIFIPKVQDITNDFWMTMASGAKSAAKEYQAELTILAPNEENDYELQERYIDEAIKLKPDVIVVAPIHYSMITEVIEKINEANIKLVLIDSKLNKDLEECYIGTNNIEAGLQMGREIKNYIKKDTKIAIMSHVKGASTAIEREEGLRKGLGDEEKRIEKVLYCDSDYEEAYRQTKNLIKENPEINFIAGLNLYSTVGVARAIKEMNMGRKIQVVGFDSDMEGIEYLEEGIIDTLIVQKPFNMGYLGIEKAVEVVRKQSVPKSIYSETEIITADNIYTDENQKLLFPF